MVTDHQRLITSAFTKVGLGLKVDGSMDEEAIHIQGHDRGCPPGFSLVWSDNKGWKNDLLNVWIWRTIRRKQCK